MFSRILADRNKGFSLGAAAVMQKPISRQELYESLVDLGLFPLSTGGTLKVLVVDDDPKAVELIAVRVMDMASTVLRAYGGREAIETACRELPDLIVLDLMMPEVNGFDVVEALQQQPDTARIPIMVVTARQRLPDLIVLDLMMPEVDGFAVVKALQEQPDTARIPILVVTSKQISAEDRDRLNGHVTAIVAKAGFDRDRFAAEVRRAMSERPSEVT